MPSSSTYRSYVRLLEHWPVDTSKEGLNLGQHIRNRLAKAFPLGDTSRPMSAGDDVECQRTYRRLNRLANDFYAHRYPRKSTSSATGLSAELCQSAVSVDAMDVYRTQDAGVFRKIKDKLGI